MVRVVLAVDQFHLSTEYLWPSLEFHLAYYHAQMRACRTFGKIHDEWFSCQIGSLLEHLLPRA